MRDLLYRREQVFEYRAGANVDLYRILMLHDPSIAEIGLDPKPVYPHRVPPMTKL